MLKYNQKTERMVQTKVEDRQFSLKELRARKNETQAQTAAALGVSPQTYNAWEQDVSNVAIGKVIKLATHFGVALSEIKV